MNEYAAAALLRRLGPGDGIGELEELFPVTRLTIYRAVARAGGSTVLAPTSTRCGGAT